MKRSVLSYYLLITNAGVLHIGGGRGGVGEEDRARVLWHNHAVSFFAHERRQPLAVEKGRMLREASHGLHRCITLLPEEEPSWQWQPSL